MAYDLRLVNPEFGSDLTTTIIQLDHLRKRRLTGTAAPWYFFQLKQIFHYMESLGSARIEGNHTTIAEYVEHQIEGGDGSDDSINEIDNVKEAMEYVEDNIEKGTDITHRFIREIHTLIVDGLIKEGDKAPGAYRKANVKIAGSLHVPPDHLHVQELMDELITFIQKDDFEQYDLIKVALFHHRFTWIHPFNNGNGRVVRMLNYALLIRYGFNVKKGRILNPSCVFFSDRELYYQSLAVADKGTDECLLTWCDYVLAGISSEITKIDGLLDYSYLSTNILYPAITFAVDRKVITKDEAEVLKLGIVDKEKQSFKAGDISNAFTSRQKTHMIKKLKDMAYIMPLKNKPRSYCVNFSRSHLLRGVINSLEANDFIPPIDNKT